MIAFDRPYLIAETAYNHQGEKHYLLKMIEAVPEEVDAVKFHLLLDIDEYMDRKHSLYAKLKEWVFDKEFWNYAFSEVVKKGKDIIALCDDPKSLEFVLESWGDIAGIELHSSGLNDLRLLMLAKEFNNTIILGIGGTELEEIVFAVDFLDRSKKDIVLMYGFQSYPTVYEKLRFYRMFKIKEFFDLPMGYADHCSFDDKTNFVISALPVAFGINIVEKHFTLDKGIKRIDYQSAVSVEDLKNIKSLMEKFWKVYSKGELSLTEEELNYGKMGLNKKVPCYCRDINKGDSLKLSDVIYLRIPFSYNYPQRIVFELLGKRLKRSVKKGDPILLEDF